MNPINQCAECLGTKEFLSTIALAGAAGAIIGRIVASVLNPTERKSVTEKEYNSRKNDPDIVGSSKILLDITTDKDGASSFSPVRYEIEVKTNYAARGIIGATVGVCVGISIVAATAVLTNYFRN